MDSRLTHVITVFMAFFAIMNPIAGIPVFLSLTRADDEPTTRSVALRSLLVAFAIVAVFSVAGRLIFDVFGLTASAFRMTGGIIVFFIGLQMLQGNQSAVQHPSKADEKSAREVALSVAISPLGMPLLAGPGTIATAMNFSAGGSIEDTVVTIAVFAVLCVITYFFFIFGRRLVRYLGASALGVITRMMGLILASIGTQMVVDGAREAFNITI